MSSNQHICNTNIDNLTQVIAETGYIVIADALPLPLLDELYYRISSFSSKQLSDAKIGGGSGTQKLTHIRSDKTHWLEQQHSTDKQYLATMNNLQTILNKRLFLGLFDYECHYALYQPGSYYSIHSDVLAGIPSSDNNLSSTRILSSVLYLNKTWQKHYGGELVLYSKNGESRITSITPNFGSLVLFLSSDFPHEVNKTNHTRYSIAGWYRARQ